MEYLRVFILAKRLVLASAAFVTVTANAALSVPGRCGSSYTVATAARRQAELASRRGDLAAASARLDDGLRALGSRYATREVIDDSGMHLLLAKQAQAKGRLKQANAIKGDVLTSRLQLCTMG